MWRGMITTVTSCKTLLFFLNWKLYFRSVIVAGGTMKPVTEFSHQLFGGAGASLDRVLHFSCGHVIPPSHILPIALTNGPTNKTFDFSYMSKESIEMVGFVNLFYFYNSFCVWEMIRLCVS